MTMVRAPFDVATTEARNELRRLDAQVATMRTVLTQLLQDLVRAENRLERSEATQLLEANERLVVSALEALADAETAKTARDGSAMVEHERRHEQLREANEQLVLASLGAQELLAAAEETRRRHSTLLTLVVNELRNPFAPVRLAAAALGRPDADKTLLPNLLALIEQQMDKALRLVSEVLDPLQATGGQAVLERSTFDAAELIGAAVQTCRSTMERRRQILEMRVLRPLEMDGDSDLLTRTLMKLLTSASVHTDNGGWIRVGAELVNGHLLLDVADSGNAVSQRAAHALSDPFVLDPPNSVGREDSMGTRLTAVREMVEAHGGTVVAATGSGGRGSQFTVSLPAGASSIASDLL